MTDLYWIFQRTGRSDSTANLHRGAWGRKSTSTNRNVGMNNMCVHVLPTFKPSSLFKFRIQVLLKCYTMKPIKTWHVLAHIWVSYGFLRDNESCCHAYQLIDCRCIQPCHLKNVGMVPCFGRTYWFLMISNDITQSFTLYSWYVI